MTGTIGKVNVDRGFAFIIPDDGSRDVFLHCSALIGSPLVFDESLQEMRVSFAIEETSRGPRAVNVKAAN